jgi:hypothetical protein
MHPILGLVRSTPVARLPVLGALMLAALLVGLAGAAPIHAASANWAWIIVRQTGDHTPPPRDRGNSSGAVNRVVDLSGFFERPGAYGVELDDVGPNPGQHGAVLVSTLGSTPRICAPYDWQTINDDVGITILCFTRSGEPASARFIVNWLAASGTGGRLAYARHASPGGKCGPNATSYHSQGGQVIDCDEPGVATLGFPGFGPSGTFQASAMARTGSVLEASAGYCSGAPPRPNGVSTACFDTAGDPQLPRWYTAWFMDGLGMKGIVRTNVANLFADRPKRDSYRPPADHRYASNGKTPRIERLGKGRYRVLLPGMPAGGSAQVTPVAAEAAGGGWVPRHCVIASIATQKPQRVGVRCFDPDGDLADSRFMLSYAK